MRRVYEASPVKRRRSTNAQLAELDDAIVAAVAADRPVSLRGVYYRVVSAGATEKTESAYDRVGRRLQKLRRSGRVDYADITDGTRWTLKPRSYTGVDEALEDAAASYRHALWHDQPTEVMIFSEKDAITGAVSGVTDRWDVSLGIVRGYDSDTFTYSVAASCARAHNQGKDVYLYQLGDHDPSGVNAWEVFQRKVCEFAAEQFRIRPVWHFERLAVTPQQIADMRLLTRPTKRSDTRAAQFEGESVEVDAIPAPELRRIVENAITRHINKEALRINRVVEDNERELLLRMSAA